MRNGLAAVGNGTDVVLVHDGARPLIAPPDIEKVIEAAASHGGAILAERCSDTVKRVEGEAITGTIEREGLWLAQTPQGFRYEILRKAMDKADEDNFAGTDEASLVERTGEKVMIVECEYPNMKVTMSSDAVVAETYLIMRNEE